MSDPTVFSYTLRDEMGTEASALVYTSYNGAVETVNGLTGTWLQYGGLLDAASSAQIVGGHVKIPLAADPSWKSAPAAGSRVEQCGVINFSAASSTKRWAAIVPALVDTAISAGKIITASGVVKDIIDALLAGFTNGNYDNFLGQGLTDFRDAFVSFRKHRRQLQRSTEQFTD